MSKQTQKSTLFGVGSKVTSEYCVETGKLALQSSRFSMKDCISGDSLGIDPTITTGTMYDAKKK